MVATREICKRCWRFNPMGFHIDDGVWNHVVPPEFRNRVLCLMCFDYFATEHGIDWTKHISKDVYFVSGVTHKKEERNEAAIRENL